MIQNLLDVAKMEKGQLNLKVEPVAIGALMDGCIESFRVQVEREQKSLVKVLAESLNGTAVPLDKPLIRRVLNNLISNALRHTLKGGAITVRASIQEQKLVLSVQDNGEGIPEQYRTKIFNKFVQVERKQARLRSGTGLGLAFCKMAVELHGGHISVESQVGQGSTFQVLLPIQPSLKIASPKILTPA
jgi:signal transduction histidine kinase